MKIAFGAILVAVSYIIGFISAFLLGGLGICGFDLTGGMICFALIAGFVLPATTVRFLPAPWWVPSLAFCSTILIVIPFQILGHEWNRAVAGIGCIAVAFASAWFFRPRARKVGST
jgi:hypothetical protein